MQFLTLDDVELANKTVLVRADLNVPVKDGTVSDDSRIQALLPTIRYLLDKKAKIVLISHFGRPKSSSNPANWDMTLSLRFLTPILEVAFGCKVNFVPECIGNTVKRFLKESTFPSITLLENVRFYEGEEKNDITFSKALAELADVYVNDAFSCSHRAHASVVGVTKYLTSVAGRSLQSELEHLHQCLAAPKRPLVAIVAGSKISTKLELLGNLCQKVDTLIIGGAMANTMLVAQGVNVGQSLYEPELLDMSRKILENSKANIILPKDVIVSDELSESTKTQVVQVQEIPINKKAFDIGPKTIEKIKEILKNSKTVVWNGPVGVFEFSPFAQGSISIAKVLANLTQAGVCMSIAGGGDTLAVLSLAKVKDKISYVSTAGGAFLEWLEGKILPGVEALEQNKNEQVHVE